MRKLLSDFRIGDPKLPAAAFDRLISTLGCGLMQEIPDNGFLRIKLHARIIRHVHPHVDVGRPAVVPHE